MNQQLSWHEAIEQVLRDNEGVANLGVLYRDIQKYRDVSTNRAWRATLRGILYREMQKKRHIVHVGLGVFALKEFAPEQSLFQSLTRGEKLTRQRFSHAEIEGMLLELGNFYGYDTYTADRQRVFDGKPLSAIAALREIPPFTFPDLLKQARNIDVLWFERKARPFPKFAFEVETTPEFRRSMLKLYQLRDFNVALYIIADARKKVMFEKHLQDDPFHSLRHRFTFRSFDDVVRLYRLVVQLPELENQFFGFQLRRAGVV